MKKLSGSSKLTNIWFPIVLLVLIIGICCYYMLHNAAWLIGDDAIIIRHTGFGVPFTFSNVYSIEAGRFYPMAYIPYDILLLFGDFGRTPFAHYLLQSIYFLFFAVSFYILICCFCKKPLSWADWMIPFGATLLAVVKVYPAFIQCFATSWSSYTLICLFLLFSYFYYSRHSIIYGVLGILFINVLIYSGEQNFVIPFAFGASFLILKRRSISCEMRVYCAILVLSSILFLLLYLIFVLPNITNAYDGSHGERIGILSNAISMIWAQKLLIWAFLLLIIRILLIIRKKSAYSFFDNLLVSSFCYCIGCFALRLNWTLYYNTAVILALPAIVYFVRNYFNSYTTLAILLFFVLFYGRKIPLAINDNQQKRVEQPLMIARVLNEIDDQTIMWYDPYVSESQHTISWVKKDWLSTYFAWTMMNADYKMESIKDISPISSEIVFMANEDEGSFLSSQPSSELIFNCGGICGYRRNVK